MDDIEVIRTAIAATPGPSEDSRGSARAALAVRMSASKSGTASSFRRTGRRRRLGQLVAATIVAGAMVAGVSAYAATNILRVQLPNRPLAHNAIPYLSPLAIGRYTAANPKTIRPPIAYLEHLSSWLRFAGSWISGPGRATFSRSVDIVTRSTVRYRSGNSTVLVVLFEPSTSAARSRVFQLGTQTVRLASGRLAWSSTFPAGIDADIRSRDRAVHALEYPSGKFIVGIFSDLSQKGLKAVAPYVLVRVR